MEKIDKAQSLSSEKCKKFDGPLPQLLRTENRNYQHEKNIINMRNERGI